MPIHPNLPLLAAILAFPSLALAVGPEDPPPPSPTTTTCESGMVWDTELERCVTIRDSTLSPADRPTVARELAYAGRFDDAIALIEGGPRPFDSAALTILGYAHRQAGRMGLGLHYYDAALTADPDNLLARAYLGQAHLLAGNRGLAEAERLEIRARGGAGTWPDRALSDALDQGFVEDY